MDPKFYDAELVTGDLPDWRKWDEVPLIQLNPDARPFMARRAVSILPGSFMATENVAMRILDAASLGEASEKLSRRVRHVFVG